MNLWIYSSCNEKSVEVSAQGDGLIWPDTVTVNHDQNVLLCTAQCGGQRGHNM